MKQKGRFLMLLAVLILVPVMGAFAEDLSSDQIQAAFDAIWLVVCAALVFFMQAGFAMVETGLTRAKNAGNIMMKNLMDFCVGAIAYWAVGWALMYGDSIAAFIGGNQFFVKGDAALMRDWFFQVVFAATAATIVSGAMAERTKFSSYLIYSIFISAVIYPISGHWIWQGDGWLTALGFHDFAGSTVVHSVGGWAALSGAIILGPRIGKYIRKDGKVTSKAIMGHNLPLAADPH
jgi:Amt family ammonium transporter